MHKIQFNIKYIQCIFPVFFFFLFHPAPAQDLIVISNSKEYEKLVGGDSLQKMTELKTFLPGAVYDLRYGTKTNFTGRKLYKQNDKTFVRLAVAQALQKAGQELLALGYRLKIWDAYRPYSITKKMWDLIRDERYVANPAKGSGHNRGLAVDITLVVANTGAEVDMGTGFDNFTDTAHHAFKNLSEDILQSRLLLKTTMEKCGFRALETEWWHYSFPNNRNYEVLDLPFKKLAKYR
ncbi:MAG TPA: M15 family metallopeptidase [Flavisolibacter sp.]|jgi:D-alanyl-D-alanine dipeptidase|nr:M15 family metallopeptidase [Flavisolibacter sp.]